MRLRVSHAALRGEHERLDAVRIAREAREAGRIAHGNAEVFEVERVVQLLRKASVYHVEAGQVSPYGSELPVELPEGEEVATK